MTFENLLYEVDEPIASITLNRPKALNALTQPMWRELEQALRKAEADDAVVAVTASARRLEVVRLRRQDAAQPRPAAHDVHDHHRQLGAGAVGDALGHQ